MKVFLYRTRYISYLPVTDEADVLPYSIAERIRSGLTFSLAWYSAGRDCHACRVGDYDKGTF